MAFHSTFRVWEEHTDAGYPGGSGGEAPRGIGRGDAPESEDGHRVSGLAGGLESVDAGGRSDFDAVDLLAENGSEECERGLLIAGAADLVKGVATYAEGGSGQDGADLRGSEFATGGGEMDAVSAGGKSNVGAARDENLDGRRGCDGFHDAAGESDQDASGEMLLAQ